MDTRPTCGQVGITRQSPNPNRSRVVNPCPAGRKMGVLFLEVCTVRQHKAKGVSDGAIWTGQKSAEAIVVVLGNEGRNQS